MANHSRRLGVRVDRRTHSNAWRYLHQKSEPAPTRVSNSRANGWVHMKAETPAALEARAGVELKIPKEWMSNE